MALPLPSLRIIGPGSKPALPSLLSRVSRSLTALSLAACCLIACSSARSTASAAAALAACPSVRERLGCWYE